MAPSLITIDVGNSRIKLGRFEPSAARLPEPSGVLELDPNDAMLVGGMEGAIERWLDELGGDAFRWVIASVNRPFCNRLVDWIARRRAGESCRVLSFSDLELKIDLPRPAGVGIDRLLAAVAANRLRDAERPAVIADVGTAITVDAVSAAGVFLGGAILPGIRMSARALKQQTDLLPDIELIHLDEPPAPVGKSTQEAIHAGLFWGAVGAIRELVARYAAELGAEPLVLMTGGAAPPVARLLRQDARFEPHLVLSGIALAAREGI